MGGAITYIYKSIALKDPNKMEQQKCQLLLGIQFNSTIRQMEGYLYGTQCRNHKDYGICKNFLNQWISDDQISLKDSCYYLNNYEHLQIRGEHRYARPSFAFKFILKKNMKYFHENEMEYCYHGTKVEFIKKIVDEGLKIPDGKQIRVRNGEAYGKGIYSTKIPQYAQLYADPYEFNGMYFQVIFLLRQTFSKIKCTDGQDIYGKFSKQIQDQYANIKYIHLLHKKLMKQTDIQWMTDDEQSILIEAVIIKVHRTHPEKGQYQEISRLIQTKMKA